MNKKATIFDIQKFCINDGPGIRTNVFFKGCPLDCVWCHNPESKKRKKELFFLAHKCIGCSACFSVCAGECHKKSDEGYHIFDRSDCRLCFGCTEVCPAGALECVGRDMTVDEILREVEKDRLFYENSGGGLTVSGGEPMAQFDFLFELLSEAKARGLHVCMESCGFAPTESYEKIAPFVDIFLFDYKLTSPELHKKYTGQDNALILKNLRALDALGAKTVLRCPIIPGINDTDEHFSGIADTANSLKNIIRIDIEPYNPLGGDKHGRLGEDYELSGLKHPESSVIDGWIEKIKARTQISVIKA